MAQRNDPPKGPGKQDKCHPDNPLLTEQEETTLSVLLGLGATWDIIVATMGRSKSTYIRHYGDTLIKEARDRFKGRLILKCASLAFDKEKPSVPMLIWLTKNSLGWSDRFTMDEPRYDPFEFVEPEAIEIKEPGLLPERAQ